MPLAYLEYDPWRGTRDRAFSPLPYDLRVRIPTVRRASRSITREIRAPITRHFSFKNQTAHDPAQTFTLGVCIPRVRFSRGERWGSCFRIFIYICIYMSLFQVWFIERLYEEVMNNECRIFFEFGCRNYSNTFVWGNVRHGLPSSFRIRTLHSYRDRERETERDAALATAVNVA